MFEFGKIQAFFRKNKIKVVKMNHTFKDSGSIQFEGFIQLTENNELKITNKIPVNKYLISAIPKDLEAEKERIEDFRELKYKEFIKSKGVIDDQKRYSKKNEEQNGI